MTAGPLAGVRPASLPRGEVARSGIVLLALGAVVGLRWAAIVDGRLDGIATGLLFGLGLLAAGFSARRLAAVPAIATARREALRRELPVDVGIGIAGGAALIGLALVTRIGAAPPIPTPPSIGLPADLFGPWLAATVIVALAEELILRGALFSLLERAAAPPIALLVTSVAFALMHVPVYGWHVVPLDLGVGIFFGGLRLATGRWLGPGVAHVIADVATWWL